jgi:ATP-dependent protease ClpP protease subunit
MIQISEALRSENFQIIPHQINVIAVAGLLQHCISSTQKLRRYCTSTAKHMIHKAAGGGVGLMLMRGMFALPAPRS